MEKFYGTAGILTVAFWFSIRLLISAQSYVGVLNSAKNDKL